MPRRSGVGPLSGRLASYQKIEHAMRPLQMGRLHVSRVVETEGPTSPRFLFAQATPETLAPHRSWLAPHFYVPETDRILMSIQTFIVRTPHHVILVDTCLGNDKPRSNAAWNLRQGTYLADLERAGVRPQDVDYVLCTHLHVDHVGWNTRLEGGRWVPTFPKARYLFAKTEYEFWRDQREPDQAAVFGDSVRPIMDAGLAELVEGEHAIEDGVRLEPTPGHTPGHCSVHLASGGREAVITGDMMHHPIQIAEPDWSSKFCVDPQQAARTRHAFCGRYADRDVLILGTHFAPPTALRIVGAKGRFQPQVPA